MICREAYEYMMTQQREKGRLRSGKVENSVVEKLEEAQDEYNEVARLCAFLVKSLKEGQRSSLLALLVIMLHRFPHFILLS